MLKWINLKDQTPPEGVDVFIKILDKNAEVDKGVGFFTNTKMQQYCTNNEMGLDFEPVLQKDIQNGCVFWLLDKPFDFVQWMVNEAGFKFETKSNTVSILSKTPKYRCIFYHQENTILMYLEGEELFKIPTPASINIAREGFIFYNIV